MRCSGSLQMQVGQPKLPRPERKSQTKGCCDRGSITLKAQNQGKTQTSLYQVIIQSRLISKQKPNVGLMTTLSLPFPPGVSRVHARRKLKTTSTTRCERAVSRRGGDRHALGTQTPAADSLRSLLLRPVRSRCDAPAPASLARAQGGRDIPRRFRATCCEPRPRPVWWAPRS